jgi:uncharacterized membrane protein
MGHSRGERQRTFSRAGALPPLDRPSAIRPHKIMALPNDRIRASLVPGLLLGLGLGGFVDGIVLHQIMQWHNMGSAVLPPTTMPALVEGLVDHHLLTVHHVRDVPVHVPVYDWAFLGVGGMGFIVLGWWLSQRSSRGA